MTRRKHAQPVRAVVLSAGQGRRLLPLTADRPKCLLQIGGKSILQWQLDALLASGVGEIVVVTGYRTDLVEDMLATHYAGRPVHAEFNPFFDISDNLASCWIARQAMAGDFLLLNGDILFAPKVLERVMKSPPAPVTLTVNVKSEYDDDDMKVQIDQGLVRHVSKALAPQQVDCESIGLLYFRQPGPELFRNAINKALRHQTSLKLYYLSIIDALAGEGLVHPCEITGLGWAEIDFPGDMETARALFESA